jgi:hypothetical protein
MRGDGLQRSVIASLIWNESSSPQPGLHQRNRNMLQSLYNGPDSFSSMRAAGCISTRAAGRVHFVLAEGGRVSLEVLVVSFLYPNRRRPSHCGLRIIPTQGKSRQVSVP